MGLRTALYYPHTEIQSQALVRTALLTWDSLEFIVPWEGYRPQYESHEMAQAIEMVGVARAPNDNDRRDVHLLLEDLIAKGVPETFRYRGDGRQADYEMFPQKLMGETWNMLFEHEVVSKVLFNHDYAASQSGGLTIMSILADVMAGETRARITDRGLAYATIANVANYGKSAQVDPKDLVQVIPLTFKTIALENISLKRLIEFREREAGANGHNYRALRHLYLDRLEKFALEAAKYKVGSPDRIEFDRVFEEEMDDDLRDLKDELGVARRDALLSKETLSFALAAGGMAAAAVVGAHVNVPEAFTLAGAPATIGGAFAVTSKFGAKRRELLRKHPMAYLYEIGG